MMTRDQRMVFGRETITLRLRAGARAIAVLQPSVARRRFAVTVRRAPSICRDRPSPAVRLPPPSASRDGQPSCHCRLSTVPYSNQIAERPITPMDV
uniref:Transposase n=1 Tax=Angiostrongylus cantonensis TaxID=6313 RepID=A0A0K0DDP9_ANGCA